MCWVPLRNTVLSSLLIHLPLIKHTGPSSLSPPHCSLLTVPCPHSPHIVTHLAPSRPVWHSPLQGLGTDGICLCSDLAPHGHDDGPLGPGQRHGGIGAGAGSDQDWPLCCSAPRVRLYTRSPCGARLWELGVGSLIRSSNNGWSEPGGTGGVRSYHPCPPSWVLAGALATA